MVLWTLGPWDTWTLEPLDLGTLGPLPSSNTSSYFPLHPHTPLLMSQKKMKVDAQDKFQCRRPIWSLILLIKLWNEEVKSPRDLDLELKAIIAISPTTTTTAPKEKYKWVLEEGRGPRVPRSEGSKVQGSQGPRVPRTKISQI